MAILANIDDEMNKEEQLTYLAAGLPVDIAKRVVSS